MLCSSVADNSVARIGRSGCEGAEPARELDGAYRASCRIEGCTRMLPDRFYQHHLPMTSCAPFDSPLSLSPRPCSLFSPRMDELKKLPPVTRTVLAAVFAVTLPVLLQLVSIYPVVFVPQRITTKLELWRLVTPFLYGGKGIPLIFDAFLLFRGLSDLEESHFQRKTAEMSTSRAEGGGAESTAGSGRRGLAEQGKLTYASTVLQLGLLSSSVEASSYVARLSAPSTTHVADVHSTITRRSTSPSTLQSSTTLSYLPSLISYVSRSFPSLARRRQLELTRSSLQWAQTNPTNQCALTLCTVASRP